MSSPHPTNLESCGSLRTSKHQRATADNSAVVLVISRTLARTSVNFALATGLLPVLQRALAFV